MTTTPSMCGRLLALLLALLLAMPTTVWAQDGAAAAAEYYNQATAAYQQGDYKKAADLLDLAFGADADLVYKYNRILALQALGDYETALAELNALYTPMKADSQNRFDDIDAIRSQLEAAIQAKQTEDPDPDPNPNPDPDPDPQPATESGPNVPAIVLTAGGGVLIATGVLFLSAILLPSDVRECLGINKRANCDNMAERKGLSTSDARSRAESLKKQHIGAAVSLMAAGAVVGGIGLVLLLTGNNSDDDAGTPMSASLAPYVSHDGGGAVLQLRF